VVGLALVAVLTLTGLAAPVLATERPLAVRTPEGWRFPALARLPLLGRLLPDAPDPAEGWRAALDGPGAPAALRAPIPFGPRRADLGEVLLPPGGEHPLGTDHGGFDLASRLIHGARVSLSVGLLAAGLALLVGAILGGAAALLGGLADSAVNRLIETVASFPALFLVLAIQGLDPPLLRGLPDVFKVVLVLALVQWTSIARLVRGEILGLRGTEMVLSARAAGAGPARLLLRHLLPNAMAPALVTATFLAAYAILLEALLSFLGFGVQDLPSWGAIVAENREAITHGGAWWMAIFPGGMILLAVLSYNLLGEGLRDALDPRRSLRAPRRAFRRSRRIREFSAGEGPPPG
jgi:peptide/nickel transport system permease protein